MSVAKEQAILNTIRKIVPHAKEYLHDDAAIVLKDLILTTDTLVENTHFTLKTYTPFEIGYKALAVNLSDIAAMGGRPLYALVSLSLPKNIKLTWIKNLYKGIISCAKKYKTKIIGGNLARGKEINITVFILGKTVSNKIPKRSNAKAGDLVFVSGNFKESKKKPVPKIKLGQQIVRTCKRAALMDSSDGLADCLIQIARESKVKIIVYEDKIPFLKAALYGGEDYELVGTANKNDIKKLKKVKMIGKVIQGSGAFLKQRNGRLAKLDMKKAFRHFQ